MNYVLDNKRKFRYLSVFSNYFEVGKFVLNVHSSQCPIFSTCSSEILTCSLEPTKKDWKKKESNLLSLPFSPYQNIFSIICPRLHFVLNQFLRLQNFRVLRAPFPG